MSKIVLQKKQSVKHVKCLKCRKREATRDDQLCDSCRFILTLENIITTKEWYWRLLPIVREEAQVNLR